MELIGSDIGPFHVVRLLGRGGMGSVYLAEHSLMKDLHAIKVLDPVLTQNFQLVTRFVNEARAAAALRHPNLVRVHNIDRIPGGPWFMVLDFLDGQTLASFLASHHGPIAPSLILHILAQVASCIQHVHDHRIVHRDLKPDNIFLIQHGDDRHFPVVLDLGVAQLSEELSAGPLTKTGTVIGTPIYMAPEQLRGERVSPAADIFALGVIAYELSTGGFFPYQRNESRAAYIELAPTELYHRQCSSAPFDPRCRCAGLGDAWASALYRALAPDPRARPPSAAAFAVMLAEAAAADSGNVDGLAILRAVARDLLSPGGHRDVPPAVPTPVIRHDPHAAPAGPAARREPITTLAGAASQSLHLPPPLRSRWPTLAAGGIAALLAGAASVLALTRLVASPPSQPTPLVEHSTGPAAITPTRAAIASPAPPAADSAEPTSRDRTDTATTVSPPSPTASTSAMPRGAARPGAAPLPPAERAWSAAVAGSRRTPSASAVPVAARTGALAITVRPWAKVWLNERYLGVTPYLADLAVGAYTLRLSNDAFGKVETRRIAIAADQTTRIDLRWTDNQPDALQ